MSVRMVNIGAKAPSRRRASAEALVSMSAATADKIASGSVPKGNVLDVAKVAAISACKRTADLLPLCHPLAVEAVEVSADVVASPPSVRITATCGNFGKTGPEMEALTAAAVAALTVYDMCKGIDSTMSFTIRLLEKSGGSSSPSGG